MPTCHGIIIAASLSPNHKCTSSPSQRNTFKQWGNFTKPGVSHLAEATLWIFCSWTWRWRYGLGWPNSRYLSYRTLDERSRQSHVLYYSFSHLCSVLRFSRANSYNWLYSMFSLPVYSDGVPIFPISEPPSSSSASFIYFYLLDLMDGTAPFFWPHRFLEVASALFCWGYGALSFSGTQVAGSNISFVFLGVWGHCPFLEVFHSHCHQHRSVKAPRSTTKLSWNT